MRVVSIFALTYAALSAYLFYAGFPITGVIYLLIGFLLFAVPTKYSAKVIIAVALIHISLLASEIVLTYRPCASEHQENVDYRNLAKDAAKSRSEEFDERTVYDVVADLRRETSNVFPASGPAHFAKSPGKGNQPSEIVVDGSHTIPLGVAANSTYVYGNEGGQYRFYKSDEFGFRNPEGIWQSQINIAALGDSFTNGSSVKTGETYVDIIRSQYPHTLNLSHGSNSPLHNLAAIREYLSEVKPGIVLWFHFENDIRDLRRDKSLDILTSYLRPDYRQDLKAKQDKVDPAIVHFLNEYVDSLEKSNATTKAAYERADRARFEKVALWLSQYRTLSFAKAQYGRLTESKNLEQDYADELLLFKQILKLAADEVRQWGGKLYFVYLPQCERYCEGVEDAASLKTTFRDYVLACAKDLSLLIVDIQEEARKQTNPEGLYFSCPGGHFNERGHRFTAEVVLQHLEKR